MWRSVWPELCMGDRKGQAQTTGPVHCCKDSGLSPVTRAMGGLYSSGCVGDALKGARAEGGRCDLMVTGTKKVTVGVRSLQILHAF